MTKNLRSISLLGILGVLVLASFTIYKKDISYSFNKGDKFKYSYASDVTMIQTIMSQKQEIKSNSTYVFDMNVVESSGSTSKIEAVVSAFKSSTSSNGQVTEYDSENEAEKGGGAMGGLYKSFVGHTYSFDIDNNGTITNVKGADELIEKIMTSLGDLPAMQKDMVKTQLKSTISEGQIREMFNQIFISLKEGGASKGDSWKNDSKIAVGNFDMTATKDFNFASVENNVSKVDIKGSMKTPEGASMNIMGMEAKVDLSGQLQGEAFLNENSVPQKALYLQMAKGDMKITEPTSGQLMVIPMEVTTEVKIQNLK
ncbi:DUF6263 family protein [Marinigracilibium pacificum]|uniref:Uncharacterized protein n=1 Tax=Marinigracilibium pacificum TaxID=2729599 RepID=A0A848IXG8_9BACT|nr:DUF6263 family protein [Marinigracilibium pacificum]NMM46960.1 hypothetical protein [Marinigracilibium pacificum]